VLVSVNLESDFGNYSYPVKIYEAIQSNTPVVAISTPATKWILCDHEELLAPPANPQILAEKIMRSVAIPHIDYQHVGSWEEYTEKLEKHMAELLTNA
jgi:glycosyltransferase involved in cell wall biosynthesis